MKKVILTILALLLLVLVPTLVFSQTWHPANQVTLAWNAVTLPDGDIGTVAYDVWSVGSAAAKSTAVKVTRVTSTQAAVTFTADGRYFLGVSAVRLIPPDEEVSSDISWSDDPTKVASGTFGVSFRRKPGMPAGIRLLLGQ